MDAVYFKATPPSSKVRTNDIQVTTHKSALFHTSDGIDRFGNSGESRITPCRQGWIRICDPVPRFWPVLCTLRADWASTLLDRSGVVGGGQIRGEEGRLVLRLRLGGCMVGWLWHFVSSLFPSRLKVCDED